MMAGIALRASRVINVRDRENLFSELKGRDGVSVFFLVSFFAD